MRLASTLNILLTSILSIKADDPKKTYDDVLQKGILFNEESKILLAEKFVPVQFLVPFPKYNFSVKPELKALLRNLNEKWNLPSASCPLDFSTNFQANTSSFNVDWLLRKVENEVKKSQTDVDLIRNETATFLKNEDKRPSRKRRGAHVGALAMAGIGLFGSGMMVGGPANCGLTGIFGSCQDQAKENAANIEHLGTVTTILVDHVSKMKTDNDAKFFIVSNILAEIEEARKQMTETLNKNWQVVQEQLKAIENNFHILRDCTQLLFSNQQLNFNFDTTASLLSLLYADVKSYRAAVYTYRTNILNSISTLLEQHLPMSIVPKASLMAILQSVADELILSGSRLSLAIPPNSDILSYYDSKLLRDVITVKEGLLLTLAIPLASRQTVFTTYSAKVIPMPQDEPRMSIKWVIEDPYLAISEDQMESMTLSQVQFDSCLGSSRYRICQEPLASQANHPSCLATLFLSSPLKAAETCDTEVHYLPTQVQADNLGYGIWLITSATDAYEMREYSLASKHKSWNRLIPGCKICIMTVDCDFQVIIGDNIKIRSDLESCDKITAKFIDVQLPDPLAHLMASIPDVEQLPYFESRTVAGVDLLRKVRAELLFSPKVKNSEDLVTVAKPFTSDMLMLKPTLKSHLSEYVPIKISLSLTVIVFILNLALHVLFIWFYHKFKFVRKYLPKFLTADQQIEVVHKPIAIIHSNDPNEIEAVHNILKENNHVFSCAFNRLKELKSLDEDELGPSSNKSMTRSQKSLYPSAPNVTAESINNLDRSYSVQTVNHPINPYSTGAV